MHAHAGPSSSVRRAPRVLFALREFCGTQAAGGRPQQGRDDGPRTRQGPAYETQTGPCRTRRDYGPTEPHVSATDSRVDEKFQPAVAARVASRAGARRPAPVLT